MARISINLWNQTIRAKRYDSNDSDIGSKVHIVNEDDETLMSMNLEEARHILDQLIEIINDIEEYPWKPRE